MSSRTLIALLATLAVLVALAVAVSVSERQPVSATGTGQLLPDLKSQINDIERIVVRTAGGKVAATLNRDKSGWVVAERDGYAADVGRIRKLLIDLADARILEEKTSNPELYDRLKVEDIAKATAGGVQLDLKAGEKLTSVIIGSSQAGGNRNYARRAGEARSWLLSVGLDVPREAAGWLDKRLTAIAAERIRSVVIRFPDGAITRLARTTPGAGDLEVLDLPAGRALAYPGVANALGAALVELEFEAAEPAASFDAGDVQPVIARFETFDGLVVEVSTFRRAAGERVRFSVAADEKLRSPDKAGADQASKDAAAPKPFTDVADEATALNARLSPWVFTLPAWKAEQFTKRLEDLLQPRSAG